MSGLSLQNFHKKLHVTVKKYNLSNVTTQPEKPDFISLLIRKKIVILSKIIVTLCVRFVSRQTEFPELAESSSKKLHYLDKNVHKRDEFL